MNLQQLKQNVQNNLWYGENRRQLPDSMFPSLTTGLIQPDYSRTWLIDISPWDGVVDLTITKGLGCAGVWIKGVDGTVNSKYFPENYNKAVQVGLARSSYAWLYRNANVSCVAQAQAFDTLLNKYPPSAELLPVVDFETTKYGGVYSNPDFTDLRKWLTEYLRLGNPKPLLYSGKYYMDQFGQIPADVKGMLAGLFIAAYGSLNPLLPFGWTSYEYHQFAATGDAEVIAPGDVGKKELDLTYPAGTVTQPPPGGSMYVKGTTKAADSAGGLKVRSAASTSAAVLGSLPYGTPVEGYLENGWIKIRFNDQDAYISAGWVTYTVTTPPEPPAENTLLTLDITARNVQVAGDVYEAKGVKLTKVM